MIIRKLGYTLRWPVHQYVQATHKGVRAFKNTLKKLRTVRNNFSKTVMLFADEAGFTLHPKRGRVWVKKGTQPIVPTCSQHQKRVNVFGWVEPLRGLHGMIHWVSGNTEGFIYLLKQILRRFRRKHIILWVDNASWHKGKRVEWFVRKYRRIEILYTPPYHPELNPQERIWKALRYEETTNVYFESIEDLQRAISKRSQRWKPKKIKSLCKLT